MATFVLIVALGVSGLMIGLNLWIRSKARAMRGKEVPRLPGPTGQRLARTSHALVYFFSPSCGACRAWTPRFRDLSSRNPAVFVVDVFQETEIARGLQVMGTPSVVEIAEGRIVGYHVGAVPREVMARFA